MYWTVHAKLTIGAVPCVKEVDRKVHVVDPPVALRNAQTFVAPVLCAGSKREKAAKTPGSCVTVTVWPPIVTVPERTSPPFAMALIVTVPLPRAFAEAVRNAELLVAVHEQFAGAVTLMSVLPPPLLTFTLVDDNVTAQLAGATSVAAAWEKLTTVPFTAMLAARAAPEFAAMLYATDPFPVPEEPEVMLRKLALLPAVHAQFEAAVTGIVPVVAAADTFVVTLPSVTEQAPDGDESLFEHAAATSATPADAMNARNKRECRIWPGILAPIRYDNDA